MTTPPFNWNDLRFLLAVARSRTISLAGRRTGTDHATVSRRIRSEEHTSELQSLMRISYAVFCLKKKTICCIYYTAYRPRESSQHRPGDLSVTDETCREWSPVCRMYQPG